MTRWFCQAEKRTADGFTLVELLVVVSIIALLLSILLPSLRGARDQAKQVVCMSHQQAIQRAFMYYAQDHLDRLPGVDGRAAGRFWWETVDEYLDERIPDRILDCTRGNMPDMLFCPCGRAPFPNLYMSKLEITHYFLNGAETDGFMGSGKDLGIGLFGGDGKTTDPKSPSKCMMLGESANYNKIVDMNHAAIVEVFDAKGANKDFARTRYHHRSTAAFFHDGRMNIAFADGHGDVLRGRNVGPDDEYACDSSQWPKPMRSNPRLFYPGLTLPAAEQDPLFWGPPYDRYKP